MLRVIMLRVYIQIVVKLRIVMLSAVMPNDIILNVALPNVVVLSAVPPFLIANRFHHNLTLVVMARLRPETNTPAI